MHIAGPTLLRHLQFILLWLIGCWERYVVKTRCSLGIVQQCIFVAFNYLELIFSQVFGKLKQMNISH